MIAKFLVLIALIAIAWYGFRLVGRRNRLSSERAARAAVERDAAERRLDDAQDTTRCAVCGTFVPTGAARDCGRDRCPYPD